MAAARTVVYRNSQELLDAWNPSLGEGDVVLVKGSRALGMEKIVQTLAAGRAMQLA